MTNHTERAETMTTELTRLTGDLLSTGIAEVAPTAAKSRIVCFDKSKSITNDIGPTVFYGCVYGDDRYIERWDDSTFTQRWQVKDSSWDSIREVMALSLGLKFGL